MPLLRGADSATDHGGRMPAYLSDLNPIEGAFSKVKQRMRRTAARTHDGWIRHSGYRLAVR